MSVWDSSLSHDYTGRRFVVDGDIIDLYAYEYGASQSDAAREFHAEPLDEYERMFLHDWIEHHDAMLKRTCDALEAENAKLRRFVTIRDHCIAGGCDLCQYRKNHESEDVECELDDLGRELGI